MNERIGIGYDIHRLVKGRKLILGGVEISYEKGLKGHSDADVLLHAICDALLGAIGQGDIGEHFPDTDEEYRDISSLILLSKTHGLVKKEGFKIGNIDTIIIAEEPKLQPFKSKMRFKIAKTLSVVEDIINIKATTQEGLGFGLNGKEAICAYASVLLTRGEP